MMDALEAKALERGFKRAILQTRSQMTEAVHLYTKRGYEQIENYPPYVEDETNGLLTYDRKVVKVHAQRMVQINRKLIESFEKATSGISEDT